MPSVSMTRKNLMPAKASYPLTTSRELTNKAVGRWLRLNRLADLIIVISLLALSCAYYSVHFDANFLLLEVLAVVLLTWLFKLTGRYRPRPNNTAIEEVRSIFLSWGILLILLLLTGYLTKTSALFSRSALISWSLMTPIALAALHLGVHHRLQHLYASNQHRQLAVIVGTSDTAALLAQQISDSPQLGIRLRACFRLPQTEVARPLVQQASSQPSQQFDVAELDQLLTYVQTNRVDVIYIAPPISDTQLTDIITDLQDTTASVYLIPNVWLCNLLRSRLLQVNGIPMIALWDSPLHDLQYDLKRILDIGLALFALIGLAPLLVLIALAVKLSSPGPVLFRQRRYGLNGQEILIYKFRSMTVMEDGAQVQQAKQGDQRITPVGRVLRRTSLDELPQFLNVLQGRMSLVGPRPHAVAHNEEYRKLIWGYMLRHKVKPGITGWAQIHGLRGETDSLEKMQKRIEYDLDYINHWSLWLDLQILLRTVIVVFRGLNAY